MKLRKCPVCNEKRLSHTIRSHIIQTATREVYKLYIKKGYIGIGTSGKPHEDFLRKHKIKVLKFQYEDR